jgi:predicted RNA binding protein YcfA (HicA-like mRNA interferase family)
VAPVHPGRTIKERRLRAVVRDADLSLNKFVKLL